MPTSFSAGRVLGKSLALLFSNAGAFVLITALVNVPWILFQLVDVGTPLENAPPAKLLPRALMTMVGVTVVPAIASAAVTYGVLQQLAGRQAGFGASFRLGFARMIPVIGVSLIQGLLTLAGAIACVIPAFVIMSALFVSVPAAVVERADVGAALGRSNELTRGKRWSVFGVLAVLIALNLAFAFTLVVFSFDPATKKIVTTRSHVLVSCAVSVIFQALHAITTAVAYHDLRIERESATSNQLADAFD